MNSPRNLQDILGSLTEICAELAQHESQNAYDYAVDAQHLAGVKIMTSPEKPSEAEAELEQKKREMVQRDANIAAECKTLSDEYTQLESRKDSYLKTVERIVARMSEIDGMRIKLSNERDALHQRWCAEIARPANSGVPKPDKSNVTVSTSDAGHFAAMPWITRRDWVKALNGGWTDEQVAKIVRRINDLMAGRVMQSRVFYFGLDHDSDDRMWTVKDLLQLGIERGVMFPG